MGHPSATTKPKKTPAWVPPIPPEHGARSMLAVALSIPLAVSLGVATSLTTVIIGAYVLLSLLSIGVLFFREAVRRRIQAPTKYQRQFTLHTIVQGAMLVLLSAGLMVLKGWAWAFSVIVIPAAFTDIVIRQRGVGIPLWDELTGVLAISLAVPVGAVLLGIVEMEVLVLLYGLFVSFHVLGVARVKTVLSRNEPRYRTVVWVDVGVHLVGLLASGGVWFLGHAGIALPIVFFLSLGRALYLVWQDEAPPVPKLGRGERAFSIILVLAGPWLLP